MGQRDELAGTFEIQRLWGRSRSQKKNVAFIIFCNSSYLFFFSATNINRCRNSRVREACFCFYFFTDFWLGRRRCCFGSGPAEPELLSMVQKTTGKVGHGMEGVRGGAVDLWVMPMRGLVGEVTGEGKMRFLRLIASPCILISIWVIIFISSVIKTHSADGITS